MSREIERLTRMVDRVLDLSRMERGRKQFDFSEANLPSVVKESTLQMRGEEEPCEVDSNIDEQISAVVFDQDTIGEVLHNLLHNAVKYSEYPKKVSVRLEQENGSALLSVEDNSISIAKRNQKRIFERVNRSRGSAWSSMFDCQNISRAKKMRPTPFWEMKFCSK